MNETKMNFSKKKKEKEKEMALKFTIYEMQ
jgi:hypothetical protein